MFSGIMEKINNIKKLSAEEKIELKEGSNYHHKIIGQYIEENPNLPLPVLNALQDRQIVLSQTYMKL